MSNAHKYYEIKGDKIKRTNSFCPRCKGDFLAEHKDRRSCGHCGYTEFAK